MYGQLFTAAIDEFLASVSSIRQWQNAVMAYPGIGSLNFKQSVRISDTSNSDHFLSHSGTGLAGSLNSFGDLKIFNNWFNGVIHSKLVKDDPILGIYVVVISEGESLRSNYSDQNSWIISSGDEKQPNGEYCDCSIHSYTQMDANLGLRNQYYFWAMVSIPSQKAGAYNCFSRNSLALGGTGTTTPPSSYVKRNAVMNSIFHELVDLVTDPFVGTAWQMATNPTSTSPQEAGDACLTTYVNTPSTLTSWAGNSFRANTINKKHGYMIQAVWHPLNQRCQ